MSSAISLHVRRLAAPLFAALAVAVCWGAFSATGASALTAVVCKGVSEVSYSPALTNTLANRTITEEASYASCVSPTDPDLHSVTVSPIVRTGQASCLTPLGSYSGSATLEWNTGATSTYDYNATASVVDGQVVTVVTGSISAGELVNASTLQETVLLGDLTACSGSGLTSESGQSVLKFLGL